MIGVFLTGALAVAALSVIVNPQSRFADVLDSFGTSVSEVIKASKSL